MNSIAVAPLLGAGELLLPCAMPVHAAMTFCMMLPWMELASDDLLMRANRSGTLVHTTSWSTTSA